MRRMEKESLLSSQGQAEPEAASRAKFTFKAYVPPPFFQLRFC